MNNGNQIHLFNGFTLDLARECVHRAGETVHLRRQTFEVLRFLVENQGHVITKDRLIEAAWQGRAVTDSSLVKCIEEVREALGPDSSQYVRTVRGRGYIFDAGVQADFSTGVPIESEQIDFVRVLVHEEQASTKPASVAAERTSVIYAPHRRRVIFGIMIAAIVLAGVTVLAIGGYWHNSVRQSGPNQIIAVPFSEINMTRLTTSGTVTHAAISPDGKYAAAVIEDANGDSLWVRNISAPSNIKVAGPAATEYVWVGFAPDGNSVYFLALDRDKGDTELSQVPVLGGASSSVVHDVGPIAFSPDRKQIAFIRFHRSESNLVIADADGSNEHDVATRHKPDSFELEWNAPAWSPDGKTIAVPARLNDARGHYAAIIGVSVRDGTQAALTSTRWNYVGQQVWLADGKALLLTASEAPGSATQVWHVNLPRGDATLITHDLNNYQDLSLTSDGSRVAAVQVESRSNIWIAPEADAARAKQVRSEIGQLEVLAWTQDGRIVYRSSAGGNGADIWIMNADGSNVRQLTIGARVSRGLTVTPDDRYIIFSSDRAGQYNLWRMDTGGGNLRQLTAGDGEFYPVCTSDGRWVVYQSNEVIDPRLWRISTEGGEPMQLTKTRATKPGASPDGQMIAYSYLDVDLNPSRWGIGIISSEGGDLLKRFDFPPTVKYRQVRWSPDGQAVAFVNNAAGQSEIWLQPLNGSPPKQLTNFKAEQILAFDWSRDGHTLAFVRNIETSDVVLIEQKK